MNRKTASFAMLCLLVAWGGLLPAFAQDPPADSLAGKIVHLYLPTDEVDSLILRNWVIPARKSGRYWHTFTLRGDRFTSNQGFFFSSARFDRFVSKEGYGATERTRFQVADFQGKQEMWIVIDPSGPLAAPPVILLEPPKIINVLNPWEATAPEIVLPGGTRKPMTAHPDRCGWFMAFLLKPNEMSLHFQERLGAEVYGTGGRDSEGDYGMAAQFAARGTPDSLGAQLWLDTDLNAWLPAYPNKDGTCRYLLAATVRDFSSAHPDFEFSSLTGDYSARGIVEPALRASDRRPVRSSAPSTVKGLNIYNDFDSWWRTDSTHATPALRSYETCVDIPLSKAGIGRWEYDSYRTPARGFWPIDNFANPNNVKSVATCSNSPDNPDMWTTGGPPANMNFCMESHARFVYRKGQKFELRGDDDVWVFIADRLVLDMGGLHNPQVDSVDLDKLDLTPGREYAWDLFYCERQPCGSALRIRTEILLQQPKPLYLAQDSAGPGAYRVRIMKRGGAGSCGGQDTSGHPPAPAADLAYRLMNAAGAAGETLAVGSHYGGGIVIAPPSVSIDTAKLSGSLPAGAYRVVAFEPANPSVRVEIPFRIGQVPTGFRSGATVRPRSRTHPLHDALGRARKDAILRKVFRRP